MLNYPWQGQGPRTLHQLSVVGPVWDGEESAGQAQDLDCCLHLPG